MLSTNENYIGPAAGVATSLLWTATSLLFTAAGRRLGPTVVNGTRIGLAIVLLGITHRLLAGSWIPDLVAGQVVFLALSGIVGLAIGDQALFTAFVDIGPRLSMLIMATSPIFAALFGWIALGEVLSGVACVGMAVTIGGVAWVVLEQPKSSQEVFPAALRYRGIVLAFVGAACQAGGLLLSKQGIGHGWLPQSEHIDPQAATYVRMVFAGLGVLPILLWHGLRSSRRAGAAPSGASRRQGTRAGGFAFAAAGATVGPFLGVWMSLVASDRAPLGIAQTLCSLPPVFILPCTFLFYRESVSPRAILGAFLAVGGGALLFLKTG